MKTAIQKIRRLAGNGLKEESVVLKGIWKCDHRALALICWRSDALDLVL